MQSAMKQDRDLIDKASSAFVSFIRYYKEQTLHFIFAMNLLDIGHVANSFFLFKVPRVKEILGKSLRSFQNDPSVDVKAIEYKDHNKMMQKESLHQKRQQKLELKLKVNKEIQEQKPKKNLSKS